MSITYEQLQAIGKSAADSIAEMVAALECDYDRLEELREERDDLRAEFDAEPANAGVDFMNWARNQTALTSEEVDEFIALETAAGDCESRDDAEQRIQESSLEITLSGEWNLGDTPKADKAYILLGTGGPATRIVCELDVTMEPHRAYIQAQDWGTQWTDCLGVIDQDTLLTYCQQFYFGEG
jgi:hypothetical protein